MIPWQTKDGSVPSFSFWSSHAPLIEDGHEDDLGESVMNRERETLRQLPDVTFSGTVAQAWEL